MMELDKQTLMVICAAIVGLTLFGGFYLSAPPARDQARHVYAQDDIRHKLQQEDAKKKKKKGKRRAAQAEQPTYTPSSSGGSDGESHEEPSVFDHEPQEEPPLD